MALSHLIPEVWSAQILESFRNATIWAGIVNRQYEGEAKRGNTVHIPGITDVTVKDYKAANRTTTAEAVTDTGIDLLINQEKAFDFYVDDIDKAQAVTSVMDAYTNSAAAGLVTDSDTFLAALAVTGGTAVTPAAEAEDGASAWNTIRDLRKALSKAKVPQDNRVLVVNAEFSALLEENDAKIMSADTSGSTDGLRNAVIGNLLGFTVYNSENLPTTDKPQAVAFHKSALAYASQIEQVEGLRAENKFADRLRGLHVYGGKVIQPTAIAVYTHTA